jgi:CRISPR-associated endonuclease/helicase Cas3
MTGSLTEWAHSPNETGTPEPLLEHLELVATLCEEYAAKFGAGPWGYITGLWHDLGKFSREFQAYIRGQLAAGTKVDHSTAGAQYAAQYAGQVGKLLAYCIAGHHSGLANYHGADPGNHGLRGMPLSERLAKAVPDWAQYALPAKLLALEPAQSLPFALDKDDALFQLSFLVRMLFSALVDADFLATESFLNWREDLRREKGAPVAQLAAALEKHLATLSNDRTPVNRLRRDILTDCVAATGWLPGFFSLTVPTGAGKTLASLMFALRHAIAHGLERVIVVVPYISIIEQVAEIYRHAFTDFGGATIVEHHSIAEYDRETSPLSIRLATENWDGTIIVTTAVQFYDSLFASKPSKCRKLHRIVKSVVILDEAQTLPVGLLGPCLSALRALVHGYQSSVVLCTATQPALGKRPDFAPGLQKVREIIRDPVTLYNAMRRVRVTFAGPVPDAALLDRLAAHRQVLCIVNTTRHAARLAVALAHLPGTFHLSARMCPVHRLETLGQIKARLKAGEPCSVISTQVVEAGVDVDFPIVYRALCGLDSLAQAAGRCNREGLLPEPGQVIFFLGDEPPIDALKAAADACLQVLPDHLDDPLSLPALDHYFRQFYWARGNYDTKEILPCLTQSGAEKGEFQFESAAEFALIDSPTQAIIISWEKGGTALCAQLRQPDLLDHLWLVARLTRQTQRYSVNVWPNEFEQLRANGRIELVNGEWWILRNLADYSPVVGLLRQDASGEALSEIG